MNAFDGKYNATITVVSPPDVVPVFARRTFILPVVNGTPFANEVLGTIGATGQLASGRAVIDLRIGPSATLTVPLSGLFAAGGFRVTGSAPCGSGICVVTVAGARIP